MAQADWLINIRITSGGKEILHHEGRKVDLCSLSLLFELASVEPDLS
jgi:hypothetical protein